MRRMIVAVAVFLLSGAVFAQTTYNSSGRSGRSRTKTEKGFDPDKLIIGGGIGLSFGDITAVSVAPIVGYRFTENFAAGVGIGYQYVRVRDYWSVNNVSTGEYEYYPYKSNLYYPSVWVRHTIYQNLFAHAEFEYDIQRIKVHENDPDPASSSYGTHISYNLKFNSPALLLGLGLRQPVSDNSSFVLMALYDVIQNKYSPYYNRIDFRVGFNAGF